MIIHIVVAIAALLIAGLMAGSVARSLVPGRVNLSLRATAALGIVGSFAGSLILWFATNIEVAQRYGVLAAMVGSVLLLVLCRMYNPKIVQHRTVNTVDAVNTVAA